MIKRLSNSIAKRNLFVFVAPSVAIVFLTGVETGKWSNNHLVRATASQQRVSKSPGNITDGFLGKKVGTVVTVEGKRAVPGKDVVVLDSLRRNFVVQSVDDKLVNNRLIVLSRQQMPDGTWFEVIYGDDRRYRLRMYESIEKIKTGNEAQPYRFQREFVVVEDLNLIKN